MMVEISIDRNDVQNHENSTQDLINKNDLLWPAILKITHTHAQALAHCEETWGEFSLGFTMFLCPHLPVNTVL